MSRKKYVIESAFETVSIQKIMQLGIDASGRIVYWADSIENVEELNSDYINEHFGELQDEAYQKGFEDGKKSVSDPDRIEVGDIVDRYIDGKFDSRGIYLGGNGEVWDCLFWANTLPITLAYPKGQFKKTGKHYDIQSILEAMRE